MKALIADDNEKNRKLLRALLTGEGYRVVEAGDGLAALEQLRGPDAPEIVLLDWEMPGMDGLEVCRTIRGEAQGQFIYIVIVTVRDTRADVLAGLASGADDFVSKPFDQKELLARVRIGKRMVMFQRALADRVAELETALNEVSKLRRLLPMCSYCKKIRDDNNYWQQVETYIASVTGARFSHSFCPDCYEKHLKPQLER